jgi:hypothetical protein
MISVLDLKQFIAKKKLVSLSLILQSFAAKQEEIVAILELLIHKGCVKKCVKTPDCATRCLSCTAESFILYQWVEQEAIALDSLTTH